MTAKDIPVDLERVLWDVEYRHRIMALLNNAARFSRHCLAPANDSAAPGDDACSVSL